MPPLFASRKYLVVDDIYDTGNTLSIVFNEVGKFDCDFVFLARRFADNDTGGRAEYTGEILNHKKWIVFPWERKNG